MTRAAALPEGINPGPAAAAGRGRPGRRRTAGREDRVRARRVTPPAGRPASWAVPTLIGPAPGNEVLADLPEPADTGKPSPVIDRTYTLVEAPEAIRYLEEEHARGKVVVTV